MAYDAIIQRLIFLNILCCLFPVSSFLIFNFFIFLLYNTVLVLPYIDMNPSFFYIYLADSALGIQICNVLFIYLVLYYQFSHLVKKLHKHHFEKLLYFLTQMYFIQSDLKCSLFIGGPRVNPGGKLVSTWFIRIFYKSFRMAAMVPNHTKLMSLHT